MAFSGITLRDLEYVVAVAEQSSFVKASERCGVSQPSLSAQVRKVEGTVGTALFERSPRGVMLTDEGERFVGQARRVLAEASLLTRVAAPRERAFGGALRLSAISSLGPYLFPRIIGGLRRHFAGFSAVLGEGLTDDLLEALRDGQLDAVLMSDPGEEGGLAVAHLFREPFLLASPTGTRIVGPAEDTWTALPPERRLLLAEGHCLRRQALAACADVGRRDRHGTSLETLKYMVAAGEGSTLVPALAANVIDGVTYTRSTNGGLWRDIVLTWRCSDPRGRQFESLAEAIRGIIGHDEPAVQAIALAA